MTLAILLLVLIALTAIFAVGYLVHGRERLASFKGLCLFDIDGTLTTGTENEAVVQYCLDQGYAVGIATAGSMYTPDDLRKWPWMPENLHQFMAQRGFDTFNNVASWILVGQPAQDQYARALATKPANVFWPGWLKGLAMEKTAARYDLTNRDVILFDNDPTFLEGVERYHRDLKAVCAGPPCGPPLTLARVKQALG